MAKILNIFVASLLALGLLDHAWAQFETAALATNRSAQADEVYCKKVVPGLIRMAQGVDISVLDLFPADMTAPSGFLRPIFDYTCEQERTWYDPTDSSLEYQIPDQVESVIPVPTGALNIVSRHNEDVKSVKNTMAAKVGVTIGAGLFGSFSASVGYKEAQEQMLKTDVTVSETTSAMSAFEVFLQSTRRLKLSKTFQKSVANLPAKYSDNAGAYDTFVDRFGTHYFETAKFGGYLYAKSEVSNEYKETTSAKQLEANLKASFKLFVSMDIKADVEAIGEQARKEFESNSRVDFCYYGGENMRKTSDPDNGYIKEWRKTVSKNPWIFAGQLKPIQNLVDDAAKKDSLKLAVVHRMMKSYLGDAYNAYNTSGKELGKDEKAKLKEIENRLASAGTSIADLEQLDKDLLKLMDDLQRIINADRALKPRGDAGFMFYWDYLKRMKNDFSCQCADGAGNDLVTCFNARKGAYCSKSQWSMSVDPEQRTNMWWWPPLKNKLGANLTLAAPTVASAASSFDSAGSM